MVFPYARLPGDNDPTLRPLVGVKLSHGKKQTPDLFFLIDSGADYTYADYDIALWLGIDCSKVKPIQSRAADNQSFNSYLAKTGFTVGKHRLILPILYTKNFGTMGLIGQEVFFDAFRVSFERYHWQVEIAPKNSIRDSS